MERHGSFGGRRTAAALLLAAAAVASAPAWCVAAGHPGTEAACKEAGGTWTKAGSSGLLDCNMPAADAGRPCMDDSDCEGGCITGSDQVKGTAVTGRCAPRTMIVGPCLNHVRRGAATGVTCAE